MENIVWIGCFPTFILGNAHLPKWTITCAGTPTAFGGEQHEIVGLPTIFPLVRNRKYYQLLKLPYWDLNLKTTCG